MLVYHFVIVLVLVLEKSAPYETFERERGPDNVTGDTILQQTDSTLAECEGLFEYELQHEHDETWVTNHCP